MKILFLPGSYTAAAARFRVWQFVQPLRELGHQVEVRVTLPERYGWAPGLRPGMPRGVRIGVDLLRVASALHAVRDAARFDVILMNRDLVPNARVRFLEPWLAMQNRHLIFDFDDAIFLGSRGRKLERVLPHFSHIAAGNDYLAAFARRLHSQVSIWPTVVDAAEYRPVPRRRPGAIRLGWSGSCATLGRSLPLVRDVICRLARSLDFEFVIHAERCPLLNWPGVNMAFLPWSPRSEVAGLQQLDIGLMPLPDRPFERGKCALKAIRYMAVGVPAVVSPVGVGRNVVRHGETGLHCRTEADWESALWRLIQDRRLRREMGAAARESVVACYSVDSLLPRMLEVFETVRS